MRTCSLVLLHGERNARLRARLQRDVRHAELAVRLLDHRLVHRLAVADEYFALRRVVVVIVVELGQADSTREGCDAWLPLALLLALLVFAALSVTRPLLSHAGLVHGERATQNTHQLVHLLAVPTPHTHARRLLQHQLAQLLLVQVLLVHKTLLLIPATHAHVTLLLQGVQTLAAVADLLVVLRLYP